MNCVRLGLIFAFGMSSFAASPESRGLKARPNPSEYPSRKQHKDFTLAARVLTADEVQSGFVTDLERRYAVIEVAIYPAAGKEVEVSDLDFSLRYEDRSTWTRAAAPRVAAAAIRRRNAKSRDRDITLTPTVGIGHSTGPDWGDGRRTGGTSVGTGVGIGIGGGGYPDPPPASSDEDRAVMERELTDKALPLGRISTPVAGYLYFPLPQRKSVVAEELEFDGAAGSIRLPLISERPRTR